MTAALSIEDHHLAPPVELPAPTLSSVMTNRASAMGHAWRKLLCGDASDPFARIGQLDGVVEDLVYELGVSLDRVGDLPGAAWGRIAGVMRISRARGTDGLSSEFHVLRALLEHAANQVHASIGERRRLRMLLDSAQAQALLLHRFTTGASEVRPMIPFRGIVLEQP